MHWHESTSLSLLESETEHLAVEEKNFSEGGRLELQFLKMFAVGCVGCVGTVHSVRGVVVSATAFRLEVRGKRFV